MSNYTIDQIVYCLVNGGSIIVEKGSTEELELTIDGGVVYLTTFNNGGFNRYSVHGNSDVKVLVEALLSIHEVKQLRMGRVIKSEIDELINQ